MFSRMKTVRNVCITTPSSKKKLMREKSAVLAEVHGEGVADVALSQSNKRE